MKLAILTIEVVIFDFGDCWEGDLHDLAVGAFDLHAGSGERLCGFHTFDCSPHSPAVRCNNLDIVFTVERLQCCECFGYLHRHIPPWVNMPLSDPEVHRTNGMQPENTIWRIESVRVFFD